MVININREFMDGDDFVNYSERPSLPKVDTLCAYNDDEEPSFEDLQKSAMEAYSLFGKQMIENHIKMGRKRNKKKNRKNRNMSSHRVDTKAILFSKLYPGFIYNGIYKCEKELIYKPKLIQKPVSEENMKVYSSKTEAKKALKKLEKTYALIAVHEFVIGYLEDYLLLLDATNDTKELNEAINDFFLKGDIGKGPSVQEKIRNTNFQTSSLKKNYGHGPHHHSRHAYGYGDEWDDYYGYASGYGRSSVHKSTKPKATPSIGSDPLIKIEKILSEDVLLCT